MFHFPLLPGNPQMMSVAICTPGTSSSSVSTTCSNSSTVYSRCIACAHQHRQRVPFLAASAALQYPEVLSTVLGYTNRGLHSLPAFAQGWTGQGGGVTWRTGLEADCRGMCRKEKTQGCRRMAAMAGRCCRMKGGLVIPTRSMHCREGGALPPGPLRSEGGLSPGRGLHRNCPRPPDREKTERKAEKGSTSYTLKHTHPHG